MWDFIKKNLCLGKGQDVKTVATLGHQPVILGGLYSAIEDEFLPGLSLWNHRIVEDYTNTINHPFQETKWTSAQTQDEKFDMMKIDVSGLIEYEEKT